MFFKIIVSIWQLPFLGCRKFTGLGEVGVRFLDRYIPAFRKFTADRMTYARFTIAGLILTGMIVIELCQGDWHSYYLLTPLLVFNLCAGLTDWLDGAMTRVRKTQTAKGAMLDPWADKFWLLPNLWIVWRLAPDKFSFLKTPFLTIITVYLLLIIGSIELILVCLRGLGQQRKVAIKSNDFGKAKFFCEILGCLCVQTNIGVVPLVGLNVLVLAALLAVFSLAGHIRSYFSVLFN